jgi:hypothetical protein
MPPFELARSSGSQPRPQVSERGCWTWRSLPTVWGPAALPAHAESVDFRTALQGEFRGSAAGVVEEPTLFDRDAPDVFDVLARLRLRVLRQVLGEPR